MPFQWANINFGEYPAEIPLNTPLTVRVVAYCETQYNEQYIFNVEAHADIPSASHSISITWISGGGDEIDTSSMINNNDLGNTTIDEIADAVDNPDADVNVLLNNIIGDE